MNRTKILTIILLIIGTMIAACGGTAPEATPTSAPESQPAPTSTPVPEPTETTIPMNTPLPAGVLFRDDFNGELQPGWRWELEDPSRWSFVEADGNQWLQIVAQDQRSNMLMRDIPQTDFAITSHVVAAPSQNFHQASLFLFQDTENYVAVVTGFCQPCGGHVFVMETAATGGDVLGHTYQVPRPEDATDVYLKIELQDETISGYYALTPGNWERIGRFGNFFDLTSVGLSATNSLGPGMQADDLVARFDYFEISQP